MNDVRLEVVREFLIDLVLNKFWEEDPDAHSGEEILVLNYPRVDEHLNLLFSRICYAVHWKFDVC